MIAEDFPREVLADPAEPVAHDKIPGLPARMTLRVDRFQAAVFDVRVDLRG